MSVTNKYGLFYALIFGCFFLLNGCSSDLEPINVINVSEKYELKLYQLLSKDGGMPALQVTSIDPHECENAYISHLAKITDEKIEVFLNDIIVEGDCIEGNEYVNLNVLLSNPLASMPVEITLANAITNQSTLHSSKTGFEIEFEQFDALKISRTKLNRIRPEMIWGSFYLSDIVVREQFLGYLESVDNSNIKLIGDYGHFFLEQDNSLIIYDQDEEYQFTFLLTTQEDFEIFETQINLFKELDPSLVLRATNYDGNTINIL